MAMAILVMRDETPCIRIDCPSWPMASMASASARVRPTSDLAAVVMFGSQTFQPVPDYQHEHRYS
jgi:hypothetical protein